MLHSKHCIKRRERHQYSRFEKVAGVGSSPGLCCQNLSTGAATITCGRKEVLYQELEAEGEEIEKMLNGYIGFLKQSKHAENEPGAHHALRADMEGYEAEPFDDLDDSDKTTL